MIRSKCTACGTEYFDPLKECDWCPESLMVYFSEEIPPTHVEGKDQLYEMIDSIFKTAGPRDWPDEFRYGRVERKCVFCSEKFFAPTNRLMCRICFDSV